MGRQYKFRDPSQEKRELHPVWRGIGFIILVALTLGGYFGSGYLIYLNRQQRFLPFPLPERWEWKPVNFLPAIPGSLIIQVVMALLLAMLAYAVLVVVYTAMAPKSERKDPYYVPPIRRKSKGRPQGR